MKKTLLILLLLAVAGCAAKKEVYDPVTKFKEAEDLMQKESFEKARKAYQEIQEKSSDRSYDPDLMLRIADTYFGEEKYDEALVEYQAFLNYHPVNRDASYAQYQIAMCSYRQLTTIDRDPAPTRTALNEFEKLLRKYANNPYEEEARKYISICTNRLAEYELYVGRFYYKKESFKAAIGRFEKLLKEYPGSTAEKDALYYDGLAHMELGDRDLALKSFETLATKYPSMQATAGSLISKIRTQ